MRHTLFIVAACFALPARAQEDATQCQDQFEDCQDNCALRFGVSTRDDDRAKLVKCSGKCKQTLTACRDRYFEVKQNGLEAGAVKKEKHDDDLREDRRKPILEDDPAAKPARRTDPPAAKKNEPRVEDLPKRTATRVSDLEPKENKDKPAPAATPSPEAAAKPKPQPTKLDNEYAVQDEKKEQEKRKSDPAPAPAPKEKKKERALDEWDPEAL